MGSHNTALTLPYTVEDVIHSHQKGRLATNQTLRILLPLELSFLKHWLAMRAAIRLIHYLPYLISICICRINLSACFVPSHDWLRLSHPNCKPDPSITDLSLERLELSKKADTGYQGSDRPENISKEDHEDDTGLKPTTTRQIDGGNNRESPPFFDTGLLVADLLAITLACQLIGLLDVINDPDFTRSGGWLQPIPSVPSTLAMLLQRITFLSSLWVGSVVVATTTVRTSLATKNGGRRNDDAPSLSGETILQTLLLFGVFRLAMGIALGHPTSFFESPDWAGILRDIYIVGLFVSSMRFFYRQYFF